MKSIMTANRDFYDRDCLMDFMSNEMEDNNMLMLLLPGNPSVSKFLPNTPQSSHLLSGKTKTID